MGALLLIHNALLRSRLRYGLRKNGDEFNVVWVVVESGMREFGVVSVLGVATS